jgi:hypothetical protein
MCDKRRTKRLCPECSTLWHARGFGREHSLENRDGVQKKYKEWIILPTDDSDQTVIQETQYESKDETQHELIMEDNSNDETQNDPFVEDNLGDETQEDPIMEVESRDETQDDPIMESSNKADAISTVEIDTPMEVKEPSSLENEQANTEAAVPRGLIEVDENAKFNEVLQKFPTKDKEIIEQLNHYILEAIRTEDAVNCISFGKCSQDDCVNHTKHVAHFKNSCLCSQPECQVTSRYAEHITKCKNVACPFCIRGESYCDIFTYCNRIHNISLFFVLFVFVYVVHQRRHMGASVGFRHLIHEKRLVLSELEKQMRKKRGTIEEKQARSSHEFCLAQVGMLEERLQNVLADCDATNKRAREHQVPPLQLPPLSLHFISKNKVCYTTQLTVNLVLVQY